MISTRSYPAASRLSILLVILQVAGAALLQTESASAETAKSPASTTSTSSATIEISRHPSTSDQSSSNSSVSSTSSSLSSATLPSTTSVVSTSRDLYPSTSLTITPEATFYHPPSPSTTLTVAKQTAPTSTSSEPNPSQIYYQGCNLHHLNRRIQSPTANSDESICFLAYHFINHDTGDPFIDHKYYHHKIELYDYRRIVFTALLLKDQVKDPNNHFYYKIEPPLPPGLRLGILPNFFNMDKHFEYHLFLQGTPFTSVSRKTYKLTVWNSAGDHLSRNFEYSYLHPNLMGLQDRENMYQEYHEIVSTSRTENTLLAPRNLPFESKSIVDHISIEDWANESSDFRSSSLYADYEISNYHRDSSQRTISRYDLDKDYNIDELAEIRYLIEEPSHPHSIGGRKFCPDGFQHQTFDVSDYFEGSGIYYSYQVKSNSELLSEEYIQGDPTTGEIHYYGPCIDFEAHNEEDLFEYEILVKAQTSLRSVGLKVHIDILDIDEDVSIAFPYPDPGTWDDDGSIRETINVPMSSNTFENAIGLPVVAEYTRVTSQLSERWGRPVKTDSRDIPKNPFTAQQGYNAKYTIKFGESEREIPPAFVNRFLSNSMNGFGTYEGPRPSSEVETKLQHPLSFVSDPMSIDLSIGHRYSIRLPFAYGGKGNISYHLESNNEALELTDVGMNSVVKPISDRDIMAGVIFGVPTHNGNTLRLNWVASDEQGSTVQLPITIAVNTKEDSADRARLDNILTFDRHLQLNSNTINTTTPLKLNHSVPIDLVVSTPIFPPIDLPTATGGIPPYTYKLIGDYPNGLELDGSKLLGIPSDIQEFWSTMSVQVTDSTPGNPRVRKVSIPYRVSPDQSAEFALSSRNWEPIEDMNFTYYRQSPDNPIYSTGFDRNFDPFYFRLTRIGADEDSIPNLPIKMAIDPPLPYGLYAEVPSQLDIRTGTGSIGIFGVPQFQQEPTEYTMTISDSDMIDPEITTIKFSIEVTHPGIVARQNGNCQDPDSGIVDLPFQFEQFYDNPYWPNYQLVRSYINRHPEFIWNQDDLDKVVNLEHCFRSTTTMKAVLFPIIRSDHPPPRENLESIMGDSDVDIVLELWNDFFSSDVLKSRVFADHGTTLSQYYFNRVIRLGSNGPSETIYPSMKLPLCSGNPNCPSWRERVLSETIPADSETSPTTYLTSTTGTSEPSTYTDLTQHSTTSSISISTPGSTGYPTTSTTITTITPSIQTTITATSTSASEIITPPSTISHAPSVAIPRTALPTYSTTENMPTATSTPHKSTTTLSAITAPTQPTTITTVKTIIPLTASTTSTTTESIPTTTASTPTTTEPRITTTTILTGVINEPLSSSSTAIPISLVTTSSVIPSTTITVVTLPTAASEYTEPVKPITSENAVSPTTVDNGEPTTSSTMAQTTSGSTSPLSYSTTTFAPSSLINPQTTTIPRSKFTTTTSDLNESMSGVPHSSNQDKIVNIERTTSKMESASTTTSKSTKSIINVNYNNRPTTNNKEIKEVPSSDNARRTSPSSHISSRSASVGSPYSVTQPETTKVIDSQVPRVSLTAKDTLPTSISPVITIPPLVTSVLTSTTVSILTMTSTAPPEQIVQTPTTPPSVPITQVSATGTRAILESGNSTLPSLVSTLGSADSSTIDSVISPVPVVGEDDIDVIVTPSGRLGMGEPDVSRVGVPELFSPMSQLEEEWVSDALGADDSEGSALGFVDVGESSHVESIVRLAGLGITRGCDPPFNTHFCPGRLVSRGELASMLVRLLGDKVVMHDGVGASFSDIGDSVHADSITQLVGLGVVRGCNPPANDRFCPGRSVSRGELASMLVRILGLAGSGNNVEFSDVVDHTHAHQIKLIREAGIARGCNPPTNSRFCPDRVVTRGEIATFLVRAAEYL